MKFPASYIAVRFILYWHWTLAGTRCVQSSLTAHVSEIHFNITLPYTRRSPRWDRFPVFLGCLRRCHAPSIIIQSNNMAKNTNEKVSDHVVITILSCPIKSQYPHRVSHTRIECNWKCWMMRVRLRLCCGCTRSGVRIPTEASRLPHNVQTGSGAHPASW
jgi:hypothetical protein